MKKEITVSFILLFLGGGMYLTACNESQSSKAKTSTDQKMSTGEKEEDNKSMRKMNYPYTIDHPDNWETGSTQNTFNALSALKAWENRNIDESLKYFADSTQVRFDGIDKMVSKDSLRALITPDSTLKNLRVSMQDWESVVSSDKSEEYVTLWYREFRENSKGKMDSVDVINDIKMKDGKIIGLDQYERKLHQ